MNTTFLFAEDFEIQVEKELQRLGYKTARSLYVDNGDFKSQIDILACGHGNLLCVECKGMLAFTLSFGTTKKRWTYTDEFGRCHNMISAYNQNANHILTLVNYLKSKGFYSKIWNKYNSPIPIILNIPVFKDTLCLPQTDIGKVYRVKDLSLISVKNQVSDSLVRENICNELFDELSSLSDTSNIRKIQHSNYIRDCQKNKTGYFSEYVC